MKSGNSSKVTAIAVLCWALGMYAMAQKGSGPGAGRGSTMTQPQQNPSSMQQTQSMQSQQSNPTISSSPAGSPHPTGTAQAKTHVKTSPTPPGHHYGWEKGKHN